MPMRISSKPTMGTHLTALHNDIASARKSLQFVKGSDVKPATLKDLKKWLDSAVKSPTDGVKPLKPGGVIPGAPALDKKSLGNVLAKLDAQVTKQMNDVKGGSAKRPSQTELKQWVSDALVKAAEGQVNVAVKGGGTRPATADEIRSWLN